ncbi:MAG TPA: UDP-N-acetylmuramate--L-alanine ligase [Vicinamibacterales bacterium]|nr:UDP-N-acetylmuramate--L-alanine ligase [Vicinamibacterales bacterium]
MAWLGRTRRVHFVGIGGIGMSGIAELLTNLGYEVSGSDAKRSDITDRLATMGVRIDAGHAAANVERADVVVVSSAIKADNPEVMEARKRHVPVIARAEMLAELMRLRFGIAIAGAHGKTTTTSMVALMLERAGLDPTAVIGGRLSAFGSNARLGQGQYMVAEADESDRSFLKLSPSIAVVTNIDREHLESYGSSFDSAQDRFESLVDAFADFAGRVPFYGAVIACVDDPAVAGMIGRLERRVVTYGFAEHANVRGLDAWSDGRSARCKVEYAIHGLPGGSGEGQLTLAVPGLHNLQNSLAAVAVGLELGVPFEKIASALGEFKGAERRYQLRGAERGVTVVDDYGHHPTEIAAVLRAARSGHPRRLVAVFQPHRYSRTRDLLGEFGPALALADVVFLTDIYAAGEAPIAGAMLGDLADNVRRSVAALHVVAALDDVPGAVASESRDGDLVVTLGAGSIGTTGDRILQTIAQGGSRG